MKIVAPDLKMRSRGPDLHKAVFIVLRQLMFFDIIPILED